MCQLISKRIIGSFEGEKLRGDDGGPTPMKTQAEKGGAIVSEKA